MMDKNRSKGLVHEDESSFHEESEGLHEDEEKEVLAKKETKAVSCLRLIVIFLLLAVALAVSLFVFFFTKGAEESDFGDAIEDHAKKIIENFQANAQSRVQVIEGFSQDITSHALYTNKTWPFVDLPDFERRAVNICTLADVVFIQIAMMVTDENRKEYEDYTVKNQGWLIEGLSQQGTTTGDRLEAEQENLKNLEADSSLQIPPAIYKVEGLEPAPELGPGPFLSYWQMAPAIPVAALVNFNVFSHPALQDTAQAAIRAERSILGDSLDYSDTEDPKVGRLWLGECLIPSFAIVLLSRSDGFSQFLFLSWNKVGH